MYNIFLGGLTLIETVARYESPRGSKIPKFGLSFLIPYLIFVIANCSTPAKIDYNPVEIGKITNVSYKERELICQFNGLNKDFEIKNKQSLPKIGDTVYEVKPVYKRISSVSVQKYFTTEKDWDNVIN